MNSIVFAVLVAVSLFLSAGTGFAVEAKQPDVKGKVSGVESAAKGKLVDLNSATNAELKAVPGIGDAFAAKIIAGRPYANKAQLKSRKVIPGTVYEQVKDRLVARQPKKK